VPITLKDRCRIGDVSGACAHAHGRGANVLARGVQAEEKTLSFSRGAGNRVALMDLDFIVAAPITTSASRPGASRRPRRARSRSSRATR